MIELGKPLKEDEWKYVRITAYKYDALIRTLEQAGCHMEYKLNEYCYYRRTEAVRQIIKSVLNKDVGCYLDTAKISDYDYFGWLDQDEFRRFEINERIHIQKEKERRYDWATRKKRGKQKKHS